VETDTSNYALAAILSIIDTDGEVHPVAFLSRTFSTTELNYNFHDKELLAIFEAFKAWWLSRRCRDSDHHHYGPQEFGVLFDYKALDSSASLMV
jgi:hypothetical protein